MRTIKRFAKSVLQGVLFRGHVHYHGNKRSKAVYLTFDDGPDPVYTGQVLDILSRFGAKATFYLVGSKVEQYPDIARRIVSEGHAVGNHTYSHAVAPDFKTEVERAGRIIESAAAYRGPLTFRPPRGIITPRLLYMVKKYGLTLVCWNVDSEDWQKKGIDAIREKIRPKNIRDGDVILFHDNNELTVKALPPVLEELRAKRLSFSTINDLVRRKNGRVNLT